MKIQSSLDSSSIDFVRNVEVMRGLVAELREKLNEVASGGGEASRARHTSRGKMLARQRVNPVRLGRKRSQILVTRISRRRSALSGNCRRQLYRRIRLFARAVEAPLHAFAQLLERDVEHRYQEYPD
jgi:hypothetical protein